MFVVYFNEKVSGEFKRFTFDDYREAWHKYIELKTEAKHKACFMRKGHMASRSVTETDSTMSENCVLFSASYSANVLNPSTYTSYYAQYYVAIDNRPDWWPLDDAADL